jgi:WhiB family transcriptional regulator, redox-sensing transcriptional regulator
MNASELSTMNAPEPAATDRSEWRSLSACRGEDPDLFFPAARTVTVFVQLARAKAICARCPVTDECLRYALTTGQQYGVWGGTSEEERNSMRRLLRVGAAPALPRVAARAG